MRTKLLSVLTIALLTALGSVPASASIDISSDLNQGWEEGTDVTRSALQAGGNYQLTVAAGQTDTFSVTGGFTPGDVYDVRFRVGRFAFATDTVMGTLASPWKDNLGPFSSTFESAWTDNAYSHLQYLLTPGTYLIKVVDITPHAHLPKSFGFRVDTAETNTAVPEPATWALMAVGFAAVGFAGYRRANRGRNAVAVKS